MLYTIIDIYEVMRTDEVYPPCENNVDNGSEGICTDPYRFLDVSGFTLDDKYFLKARKSFI